MSDVFAQLEVLCRLPNRERGQFVTVRGHESAYCLRVGPRVLAQRAPRTSHISPAPSQLSIVDTSGGYARTTAPATVPASGSTVSHHDLMVRSRSRVGSIAGVHRWAYRVR